MIHVNTFLISIFLSKFPTSFSFPLHKYHFPITLFEIYYFLFTKLEIRATSNKKYSFSYIILPKDFLNFILYSSEIIPTSLRYIYKYVYLNIAYLHHVRMYFLYWRHTPLRSIYLFAVYLPIFKFCLSKFFLYLFIFCRYFSSYN